MSIKPAKATKPKFAKEEVQWLLNVAQGRDKSTIPPEFWWIAKMSQQEAKDELVFRFQRLLASLVEVCITGRVNPRVGSQKTLLRLLGISNPMVLKAQLSLVEAKEELFPLGKVAAYQALEKCKNNYAATVVICFRELVDELLHKTPTTYLPELPENIEAPGWEGDSIFDVDMKALMESLPEDEWVLIRRVLNGEKVGRIPKKLKEKVARFLDIPQ